jgi:hypothetical protein
MAMLTKEELLNEFGKARSGEIQRLTNFAIIPDEKILSLAKSALQEDWGEDHLVLRKYLAVHVPMSIEQERYVWNGDQLLVAAGSLRTRFGVPLYLAFEPKTVEGRQKFYLRWVGDQPKCSEFPEPPTFNSWPEIDLSSEVVIATEHILGDNIKRILFLKDTPPVAQICAISGAIQWSLHRNLRIKQMYLGVESYFVPIYLQTRENITSPPDLVAPVQVQPNRLLVRTVLLPHMVYDKARVVVTRHDELPPWLVTSWHEHRATVTASAVSAIEQQELEDDTHSE